MTYHKIKLFYDNETHKHDRPLWAEKQYLHKTGVGCVNNGGKALNERTHSLLHSATTPPLQHYNEYT